MHPRPASRQVARSLGAAATLAVLVAGVPLALTRFAGDALGRGLAGVTELPERLSRGTVPDDALLALAVLVCWAAWAVLTAFVAVEATAWASGRSAASLRGVRPLQSLARNLVVSALVLVGASRAAPPPLPMAPVAAVQVVTEPSGEAPGAADEAAPGTAAGVAVAPAEGGAEAPKHVVQPRDSLWRLAERHLRDGFRWRELYDLNREVPQLDGGALRDPDLIRPGWVLTFPADAAGLSGVTAPEPAPQECEPERPSPTAAEPDGPADAPTDDGAALGAGQGDRPADADEEAGAGPAGGPPVDDAEAPPEASPTGPGSGGEGRSPEAPAPEPPGPRPDAPASQPTPDMASPTEGDGDDSGLNLPMPAPAALAGGTLLAAGIVMALNRRRQATQRQRPPGVAPVHAASDADAGTETSIRRAAANAPTELLDVALRALADALAHAPVRPLPRIAAARATDDLVEIELAGGVDAPAGVFDVAEDGTTWRLPASRLDPALEALAATHGAPAPLLLPVGRSDGAEVLLDLEAAPRTSITGPAGRAGGLLWAITVAAATNTWADDIEILTIGPRLAGLHGLPRVDHAPDLADALPRVTARTNALQRALSLTGEATTFDARIRSDADGWTPTLVVLLGDDEPAAVDELLQLAGERPGLAVVGYELAAADRIIHLTVTTATADPPGIELVPIAPPQDERLAVEHLITPPAKEPGAAAEPPVEPAQDSDPEAPADIPPPAATDDDTDDAEVVVRVLGPVEVVGGEQPIERRRSIELVVYLALHPDGVDEGRLKAALWPDKAPSQGSFNATVSRARCRLGAARGGALHVPHMTNRTYRVGPSVAVDADRLDAAYRAAQRQPDPARIEALTVALDAVRGLPFEGTKGAYEWAHAEGFVARYQALVADAAHLLAVWHLERGEAKAVLAAAERGLFASPANEVLYRDRMRAHDLAGNPAGVEAVMEELCHVLEVEDPDGAVHPETMCLYEQLGRRHLGRAG